MCCSMSVSECIVLYGYKLKVNWEMVLIMLLFPKTRDEII